MAKSLSRLSRECWPPADLFSAGGESVRSTTSDLLGSAPDWNASPVLLIARVVRCMASVNERVPSVSLDDLRAGGSTAVRL